MDSIVDTFFPLLDFIEAESNDIDAFLADPLSAAPAAQDKERHSLGAITHVKRIEPSHLLRLRIPAYLEQRLPARLRAALQPAQSQTEQVEKFGRASDVNRPKTVSKKALTTVDDRLFDRARMLKRIADARKLITALTRLLHHKTEVVRGLRKRVQQEVRVAGGREPGLRHDIGIYLGDLQGERQSST